MSNWQMIACTLCQLFLTDYLTILNELCSFPVPSPPLCGVRLHLHMFFTQLVKLSLYLCITWWSLPYLSRFHFLLCKAFQLPLNRESYFPLDFKVLYYALFQNTQSRMFYCYVCLSKQTTVFQMLLFKTNSYLSKNWAKEENKWHGKQDIKNEDLKQFLPKPMWQDVFLTDPGYTQGKACKSMISTFGKQGKRLSEEPEGSNNTLK